MASPSRVAALPGTTCCGSPATNFPLELVLVLIVEKASFPEASTSIDMSPARETRAACRVTNTPANREELLERKRERERESQEAAGIFTK